MNQPGTYRWLSADMPAVLEADDVAMPTRIYEALAAIDQRLLSPIEAGGIESREIENAQRGLLALKAERVGDESAQDGTSVTRAGQQSEGTY
jgi:hypothetical protein